MNCPALRQKHASIQRVKIFCDQNLEKQPTFKIDEMKIDLTE